MSSLVIYSNEFDGHLSNGLLPQRFKYRFLAEGDSWMDRSSMFETSLLQQLVQTMDARGEEVLIINLAMFGETLRRGRFRAVAAHPVQLEIRRHSFKRGRQRLHRRGARPRPWARHSQRPGHITHTSHRP